MSLEKPRLKVDLSARERETLLLAADGLTDKEIARKLGVTGTTVRTYWIRMRNKLKSVNRAQTVARALNLMFRATQQELDDLNTKYGILIDTLVDFSIFIIDTDRTIRSWNPGVKRLFGFEEEEWVGQPAEIFFTPQDRKRNVVAKEMKTAAEKGRADDERWHCRKDGSEFWASGVMIPLRRDSVLIGFAKVVKDGTRMKQLETKILDLGESLDELPDLQKSKIRC